jgi:hypothetical protein
MEVTSGLVVIKLLKAERYSEISFKTFLDFALSLE